MEENSKWEAGDVAICKYVGDLPTKSSTNGKNPPLRMNAEYIVNGVHICECGTIKLDVGLYSELNGGTTCACGAISRPGTHVHWANASRFVKKKTREAIREEMDEAIHNEDYELARQLDNQLNNRP